MGRKILAISLLLVMVLSFTACGEELPTAQEIVDGAVQALDDIISYQLEMTSTMNASGESEGETFEGSTTTSQNITFDLANRKMHMVQTMNSIMTGADSIDTTTETYIVDNMVYVTSDSPYGDIIWTKSEIPSGFWEQMNQIKFQIDILGASQVEVISTEKVGGVDCYALQLTPDAEQLWQFFIQQMGTSGDMSTETSQELLRELAHNYSAKQWIAKDTYFLMKAEVEMSIELTPEIMGSPEAEGEATVDTTTIMLVYDYNQPISIELPPEAAETTEY